MIQNSCESECEWLSMSLFWPCDRFATSPGVTYLSPFNSWSRLQPPCDPEADKRKQMNGGKSDKSKSKQMVDNCNNKGLC